MHEPTLTESFVTALNQALDPLAIAYSLIVVPPTVPPYAPRLILNYLDHAEFGDLPIQADIAWPNTVEQPPNTGATPRISNIAPLPHTRMIWIGFSAGVVGGVLAAKEYERRGHSIQGFFALDGWGVPLWADFPIYSLSHDRFSHLTTSALRSPCLPHFYADPEVEHLQLWQSPQQVFGWQEVNDQITETTAIGFMRTQILNMLHTQMSRV